MRLKAYIKSSTEKTKHLIGNFDEGELKNISSLPTATWIEIVEEGDSVYLYHYDNDGICISDTWHLSIQEAKSQALFEFNIREEDWQEIDI